jgi:hypothetical protein
MDVKEVAQEVVTEVKEVVAKAEAVAGQVVKAVEKAATVAVTDAEKLAVREMENAFLKANLEVQNLQKQIEVQQKIMGDAQTKFPALLEAYFKKYSLKTEEYVFDAVALLFRKR